MPCPEMGRTMASGAAASCFGGLESYAKSSDYRVSEPAAVAAGSPLLLAVGAAAVSWMRLRLLLMEYLWTNPFPQEPVPRAKALASFGMRWALGAPAGRRFRS